MKINFKCKKCKKVFNYNVGKVSVDEKTMRPIFSNGIKCPNCGKRTIDEVILTEMGQSQLTEATFEL
jgi:ribosomal protein L44E